MFNNLCITQVNIVVILYNTTFYTIIYQILYNIKILLDLMLLDLVLSNLIRLGIAKWGLIFDHVYKFITCYQEASHVDYIQFRMGDELDFSIQICDFFFFGQICGCL